MNHYCTYFDRHYTLNGLALWRSLTRHDPMAVLWVLCLDDRTLKLVRGLNEPNLRPVALETLERFDDALLRARSNRTWIEYIFTLSPCWPRYLLHHHPEIPVLTYVDADMMFFSSVAPLHAELGANNILIVGHRFPGFLRECETRGRFNVGVLCFRNNAIGQACLDDWRAQCLAWCHDRVEHGRYADQKYLDAWPDKFPGVVECAHPGINLAPWNWPSHSFRFTSPDLQVDGRPLIVFHFARFRPVSKWRADSGQLEYGVMPLRLRSWLYERYWRELGEARSQLAPSIPSLWSRPAARGVSLGWKLRLLEFLFGTIWWRLGPIWISGRLGLGRFSGRTIAWIDHHLLRSASETPSDTDKKLEEDAAAAVQE